MNAGEPIPGVCYHLKQDGTYPRFLYAPKPGNDPWYDRPWYDRDLDRWTSKPKAYGQYWDINELAVAYNPHPAKEQS